jgi:hypothetical protein
MRLLTSPTPSSIRTWCLAVSAGSSGTHIVELVDMPCSATSGGFDGSPAVSTCVVRKEVSTSDCSTGTSESPIASSYKRQYAARASSDLNADGRAIRQTGSNWSITVAS